MKLLIDLKVTQVTCLVLDKRYNQWLQIQKQAKELGIEITPFIVGDGTDSLVYDLIDNTDGQPASGLNSSRFFAWKSHKRIFELFMESHNSDLFLLEDDIYFTEDFTDIVEDNFSIFSEEWDMLYYGCFYNHIDAKCSKTKYPNVVRLNGSGGFHGVRIKRHVVEELLKFGPIGPYDWIAGKYIHPNYICYGFTPSIICQQDGYSFVEQGYLKKPDRHMVFYE